MRMRDVCRSILTLMAMTSGSAFAADPSAPKPIPVTGAAVPELQSFDDVMKEFLEKTQAPGASLAVAKGTKLVYARGFGFSDRDGKKPVAPDSLFRIASISKPITAIAILQLVEQGKLKLDDKVFAILDLKPALAAGLEPDPRLASITVSQCLQHLGGWDRGKSFDPMFRSVEIAEDLGKDPPASATDVIRYMLGKPLDFDPGTKYAYSNLGYNVLGRVIEKVTGQSYEDYVQKNVLRKIGIADMRLGKTLLKDRSPSEVMYYDDKNGPGESVFVRKGSNDRLPQPYGVFYIEAMDSHGGWLATAADLVRITAAIHAPDRSPLLKATSLDSMYARPAGPTGVDAAGKPKPSFYGCGWQVRPGSDPRRPTIWHSGSLAGTSTLLVRRGDGISWAVLFNSRNGKEGKELSAAIDPKLHEAARAVEEWPEDDLFPKLLGKPPKKR